MARRKFVLHNGFWNIFNGLLFRTASKSRFRWRAWMMLTIALSISAILITLMPIVSLKMIASVSSREKIILYWPHPFPCPENEIKQLVQRIRNGAEVEVYAASDECVDSLGDAVVTKFLHLRSVCKGTPVSFWLAKHIHYKLIAGVHYRDQLRHVAMTCLLHKRSGAVFDLSIGSEAIISLIDSTAEKTLWIAENVCAAKMKANSFVTNLMTDFITNYPTPTMKNTPFPLSYNFRSQLRKLAKIHNIDIVVAHNAKEFILPKKYAIFSFDKRVALVNHGNMGDEIQNFVGLQYIPHLDLMVDREGLEEVAQRNVTLFMNAWFGDSRFRFGRDGFIDPIMVAVHLEDELFKRPDNVGYLKRHEPIGARDTSTSVILSNLAIENFFTGCATLLIENPRKQDARTSNVYAVDVQDGQLRQILPEKIYKSVIVLRHQMSITEFDQFGRYVKASERIFDVYATAKIVITSRIHAAMPCVALGIPVIFVLSNILPGGGHNRLTGLSSMWHLVKLDGQNDSLASARQQMEEFNWLHPPPNPDIALQKQLRMKLLQKIFNGRPDLRNSAKMFGVANDAQAVLEQMFSRQLFAVW